MISALLPTIAIGSLAFGIGAGLDSSEIAFQPATSPAAAVSQPEGPQPVAAVDLAADVKSIDGIMKALYESTAGPPGQPRDWDRLRNLCHSNMRFLAVREEDQGGTVVFVLTVEDYIMHNRTYFENGGFFESELARRTESFGNITHVWSTFESRMGSADAEPYTRGIYSVQLLKDGDRWWILSLSWDMEREGNPLPEKYLESPQE